MTESTANSRDAAFLDTMLGSANEYVCSLTQAMDRCRDCDDAEAASVLAEVSASSIYSLARQQEAWQKHRRNREVSASCEPVASDAEQSVTDKLARLTAMGGTPALGGMALPKLSQDQIHGLSNTVSPAARELHAAKGHPVDTSSHSPPTVKTPDASSPPWLVELRAKKQGSRPSSRPSSPPRQ